MRHSSWGPLVLMLLVFAAPVVAGAQESEAVSVEARAGEHFNRGMEFFEEGRHDAALAEFQRAYDLAPAYQVLYNLGRVHAELGHAVEATDAYEAFLEEGDASIPRGQRREVEAALRRQRGRIATLRVEANVEGAVVSLDGVDVARTPLVDPLRVSAGSHTVGVRAPGYESLRRGVQVAGGVLESIIVELRRVAERSGTLRIRCPLPDVTVTVNDVSVGETPLGSTVPVNEGMHIVIGRRPGYEPDVQHVSVAHNAEVEVHLRPRRSDSPDAADIGALTMNIPDAPHLLRVDGDALVAPNGRVTLPIGHHHVRLEVADRLPYEAEVSVLAGAENELVLLVRWTPEVLAEQVDAAARRRAIGMGLTYSGGALMGGSLAVLGWNRVQINQTDEELRDLNERCNSPAGCSGEDMARGEELAKMIPGQNAIQGAMIATAALGFAAALSGLIVWLKTPSEAEIEASARAVRDLRLEVHPRGLRLRGSF